MSWEHALSMLNVLQQAVSEYQAQIGEVRNVEVALVDLNQQSEH